MNVHIRSHKNAHIRSHVNVHICSHINARICSHINAHIHSYMPHIRSHTNPMKFQLSFSLVFYEVFDMV